MVCPLRVGAISPAVLRNRLVELRRNDRKSERTRTRALMRERERQSEILFGRVSSTRGEIKSTPGESISARMPNATNARRRRTTHVHAISVDFYARLNEEERIAGAKRERCDRRARLIIPTVFCCGFFASSLETTTPRRSSLITISRFRSDVTIARASLATNAFSISALRTSALNFPAIRDANITCVRSEDKCRKIFPKDILPFFFSFNLVQLNFDHLLNLV